MDRVYIEGKDADDNKQMTYYDSDHVFVGTDKLDDKLAELCYLKWFKQNADFGLDDEDVHMGMDETYTYETGNEVPKNWRRR
jgi:hypothetical protein